MFGQNTPLPDKALVDQGGFRDGGAGADNEMFHNHAGTNKHRIFGTTVDRTLLKADGTLYFAEFPYPYIFDVPAAQYMRAGAD